MQYLMENVSKLVNLGCLELDLSDNRLGKNVDNIEYLMDGIK